MKNLGEKQSVKTVAFISLSAPNVIQVRCEINETRRFLRKLRIKGHYEIVTIFDFNNL